MLFRSGRRKSLPLSFVKQPEAVQVIARARTDELPPERHLCQQGSCRRGAADRELLSASVAVGRVRWILIGTTGTGHAREEIRKMPERSLEKEVTASQWVWEGRGYPLLRPMQRVMGPLPLEVSQPRASAGPASQP